MTEAIALLQAVHDIRSPLSALKVLVARQKSVPSAQRDLLNAVVQRIEHLSEQMLTRARAEPPKMRPLYSALTTLMGEKALEWGPGVVIDYALAEPLAMRRVDTRELSRALSNLINNAAEAGARRITLEVNLRDERLHFVLADDGLGMSEDMLADLPHAPGLGIAHARLLASRLGGEFHVHSRLGEGTVVELILPGAF